MSQLLLTGGTGVLGRALRPLLQKSGYTVRVMSRKAAQESLSTGEEWVQADLASGNGLAAAVAGVDVVVHAASRPGASRVDVAGTKQLLQLARQAGAGHFVYVSIVGIEEIDFSYYRHKAAAEQMVQGAGIPWTILRATQFHALLDRLLGALTRPPVGLVPAGWRFQPIGEADVAAVLTTAVQQKSIGRLPDIGGPELLNLDEMARRWLAARNMAKPIWRLPVPGGLSAGFKQGLNTTPAQAVGRQSWDDWLQQRYGQVAMPFLPEVS